MYQKRNSVPNTWPVPRKGSVYLVAPSHNRKHGIPLLVVLREIMKVVRNRCEAKKMLSLNAIKINNKLTKDEKYPLLMFDKLEIGNKQYQIVIGENGKFSVEETKGLESKKIKILGKKVIKRGKVQLNLSDGRNILSDEKVKLGDSVEIDFKDNKIKKIIPLKIGSEVVVIGGKHLGKKGKIKKIDEVKKLTEIVGKETINVNLSNLIAI